jgi:hypothetical protein
MKNTMYGFCALAFLISAPLVLGGCGGGGTMPLTNGGGGNIGGGGNGGGANRSAKDKIVTAVQTGFSTYKTGKGSGRKRTTRNEDSNPAPAFDSFYELWYLTSEDGQGVTYFEDEACTLPAGYSRYDRNYAENGGEFKASSSFSITKGPKAGATGTGLTELVYTPEFLYTFSFIGDVPGYYTYSTTGRWDSTGGGYKSYSKDQNGAVQRYESTYNNDGTSRLLFTDENDLEFTLNFNADQSGMGRITGKDTTVLPADIVWVANGSGKITFKDGSTETFENFQFRRS